MRVQYEAELLEELYFLIKSPNFDQFMRKKDVNWQAGNCCSTAFTTTHRISWSSFSEKNNISDIEISGE